MNEIPRRLAAYVLPGAASDPRLAVAQASRAQTNGLDAVWLGERFDTKDFPSVIGALSQTTQNLLLGVGITPMNVRHPVVLASAGQTLQALTGGRFRLGFGKSTAWRWEGYGIAEPTIASMRDVATILRALWRGETVSYDGPAGRFPELRLAERSPFPPTPLYLAAIGPKTLEMAGAAFDGVILHPFLTPTAAAEAVAIVRAGAHRAGRDPSQINIVAAVVVAPELSERETALAIRARLAGYLYTRTPGDVLARSNRWDETALAAFRAQPALTALHGRSADKLLSRDVLIELTQVLPESWIHSSSVVGSNEQCAEALRAYHAAGVDEILIHGATPDQLGGLATALRKKEVAGND
jgi:probable F420-dependent oxidoreductase